MKITISGEDSSPAREQIQHQLEPECRVSIGSIGIDRFSEDALVQEMVEHALTGNVTRQVVTVNAQFYVLAERSRRFRECLKQAEYLCADGMPIVWACNTFGNAQVPRIAGVD